MLRLFYINLILFFIIGMNIAMVPTDLTRDLPDNYKEIMGDHLVQGAKFISEGDMENAVKIMKEYYYQTQPFSPPSEERIKSLLTNLSDQLFYIYSPDNDKIDHDFPLKDYIFEGCLCHFWWKWM